jgi:hypothetical protein
MNSLRAVVPLALVALAVPAVARFSPVAAAEVTARSVAASAPTVVSAIPVDVPQAALDAHVFGRVEVRARVEPWGLPDSVIAVAGDPRLRRAAEASVRWWVFTRPAKPAWTTVHVDIDGRVEFPPLRPDVLGLAHAAEAAGDLPQAVDLWIGALTRVGKHPTLRNGWAIREHIAHLVAKMKSPPHIGGVITSPAIEARYHQQKAVARVAHEDLLPAFNRVIDEAPWWGEPYEWRAASLLGAGRSDEALRSLRMYRLIAPDSLAHPLSDRAFAGIAAGDTVQVSEMLKHEGKQFTEDEDQR